MGSISSTKPVAGGELGADGRAVATIVRDVWPTTQ
jgi:hypothetical protein